MMRRAFATVVATTIALGSAAAQETGWSASAGWDLLSGRYAQGSGTSLAATRRLMSLPSQRRVDLAANWIRGSGDYSMFNCHIARQIYCFGGAERLAAVDLAIQLTDEPLGHKPFGVDIMPVASLGIDRSRSQVTETEGPTTLCLSSTGAVISCADNPPFTNLHATEWATLASYSYGFDFARRVGRARLNAGIAMHAAAWFHQRGYDRARFSFGISF